MRAAIYLENGGEFAVFPCSRNEEGWFTLVPEPELMQWDGVSFVALGEKVLKCLEISDQRVGPPQDVNANYFRLVSDAKTSRDFVKTRQHVAIYPTKGKDGLRVVFSRRTANYAYAGRTDDPPEWTVALPVNPTPEQLGHAVISVLRAGRAPGLDVTVQEPSHG
jgi:hypothetical protein